MTQKKHISTARKIAGYLLFALWAGLLLFFAYEIYWCLTDFSEVALFACSYF